MYWLVFILPRDHDMCPTFKRHPKRLTAPLWSSARIHEEIHDYIQRSHSVRSHFPGLPTNLESFRNPKAAVSITKILHKDCRFYVGYTLATGPPWLMDSVMLPGHPHVRNITTLLLQCGLLWIVADISAWQSQQSSDVILTVTRKTQCANYAAMEV